MAVSRGRVNADPSRHFFIEILTRDVSIEDAVLDLIDNSVEAADRSAGTSGLGAFSIQISFDAESFKIVDNCGGIDVETARNHAFCFGRDSNDGHVGSERPIGRFGVGMKRSMFRLGKDSYVLSTTPTSQFLVQINTDEWMEQEGDSWHFDFAQINESGEYTDVGTEIEVRELAPGVRTRLKEMDTETGGLAFVALLRRLIRETYPFQLGQGLEISVQGEPPVSLADLKMLVGISDKVVPYHKRFDIEIEEVSWGEETPVGREASAEERGSSEGASLPSVSLEIVAGVSERNLSEGGWYVFCNGRLVLDRNQDKTTGWGISGVAKYSERFARFRGYAFFRSSDAKLVPWTTTKRDVDADSVVYQRGLVHMREAMTSVMSFLSDRDKEKRYVRDDRIGDDQQVIGQAIDELMRSQVSVLGLVPVEPAKETEWKGVEPVPPSPPRTTSIQFRRPVAQVEKAKSALHADHNYEVGEKLFDRYIESLED